MTHLDDRLVTWPEPITERHLGSDDDPAVRKAESIGRLEDGGGDGRDVAVSAEPQAPGISIVRALAI